MIPLHKVPRGLLDIIRGRSLGTNPTELASVVPPIIDATAMYGSDLQTVGDDPGAAGAIVRVITRTASNPGRMIAMGAQVTMGAAAGTTLRLRLSYAPVQNFVAVPLLEQSYAAPALAAGSTYTAGVLFPEPIVFAPGSQWVLTVLGDAGGADHTPALRTLFENYAPV